MDTFEKALRYRSDQSLRDSLEIDEFKLAEGWPASANHEDSKWALVHLYCHVQVLTEMMKRLWDEFEGHQDICKIQRDVDEEMRKFVQGFGYTPIQNVDQLEKFVKQIENAKEDKMDKQIRKVEKDVKKGAKGKAMKDIKTLKKMDKKFDRKIDKAKKVMKKGC